MRRAVTVAATACILAMPAVLAFFTGGYPTEPRLIAGIAAWACVLALAATGPAPLPRSAPGRLAAGGLAALTAWTALSVSWAPVAGPATDATQRLLLYLGVLLVALTVLRQARAQRAAEPALAAGAAIVIGYGLAGRLLPGVLELARSRSAGGRLEQPITYWNGEGALAAMGLILCARLAGDASRPRAVRIAAGGACPLLGAGLYLTYSRGALAVAVVGLVVLVAAAPSAAQLRAVLAAVAAGALAALATAVLPGVASLEGTRDNRIRDGLIALAALAAIGAAAALLTARLTRAEPPETARPAWARRAVPLAAALVAVMAAGLVIGGLSERPSARDLAAGASAGRLTKVSSNRYAYWHVGIDAFADHPLTGVGAGGFRVEWLKHRTFSELVLDTHSIEVEMLADLGLPGLLCLLAFAGGTGLAAAGALRRDGALAAGAAAASLAWLLHASIDWDWQLPAVTLPAVVLAGALIAQREREPDPAAPAPPAPAPRSPDPNPA